VTESMASSIRRVLKNQDQEYSTLTSVMRESAADEASPSKTEPESEHTMVAVSFDLGALPALPKPDLKSMRMEAACGCVTVSVIIAILVSLSHVVALKGGEARLSDAATYSWLGLMYAFAAVALTCLLAIMFKDPGVIRRSVDSCLPLPADVEQRLQAGVSLDGLPNFVDGDKSFCMRCLVWRPPRSHHCRTCGRCVRDFDHHCGFFGRCIAGTRYGCIVSGNYGFFCLILTIGTLSFMVCFGFMAVSFLF